MNRLLVIALLLTPTVPSSEPGAYDWPQFGGPFRNFHARAGDLAQSWPDMGPRLAWSRPLGEGFSGIAAVGGALYTMYRRGDEEVVVAMNASTGSTRWEHASRVAPAEGQDLTQGPGPHATPIVAGTLVCAAGVTAHLRCLDATTGELRWTHDLARAFGATVVFRGYSSSPAAAGDLLIVQSGGTDRAMIAFELATGSVRWHGGTRINANASPVIAAKLPSGPQVVGFFENVVAGYDLRSGRELWSHTHPQRFGDSISLPLVVDGHDVIVSSALDGGTRRLTIEGPNGDRVRERWHQPRLGAYYTNIAVEDGMILGSSGGVGPTFFTALDAGTGAVLWQTRDIKRSNFIVAGGHLLLRDEEGSLVLARATREGLTERARATVLASGAPSAPTLVGTMLYARDRERLVAVDLSARR